MSLPINIYCCYHDKDIESWENLESHLAVLKRYERIITIDWQNISPGSDVKYEQVTQLNNADIVLLIISKHFVNDEQCWTLMAQAIEKHWAGELRVVPIRYRPIYYDSAPFATLSMLPKGKPISLWNDLDEAYVNIVEGLSVLIDSLHKERGDKQLTIQPSKSSRLLHISQEGLEK